MCATFYEVGQPANDDERNGLRFLCEQLPDHYAVYGNPWIVQQNGQVYEVDAVVAGDNAIYVVEMKAYGGRVTGNEHDWTVRGLHRRSPVKLNRKTAQILKTELKRRNGEARQVWVQGFIFLNRTENCNFTDTVCRDVVHTRSTIVGALRNTPLIHRLSGQAVRTPSERLRATLHELLTGVDQRDQPRQTLGDYHLRGVYDRTDNYVEYHGVNAATGVERILRFWQVPALADDDERKNIDRRARWEAQVLDDLRHEHIIRCFEFTDVDVGFLLPMEYFPGLSLNSWIRNFDQELRQSPDDVKRRVGVWRKIAGAVRYAHSRGVVHRLLRPDVVLVEDSADDPDLRVTGFDLAKKLTSSETVSWTAVADERLDFAAPEILNAFSDAEEVSDQFSLGALLGFLLAGKPLVENTLEYMKAERLVTRPRDYNTHVPSALDDAVARMMALGATQRFPSLDDAIEAVDKAVDAIDRRRRRVKPAAETTPPAPLGDPENLAPNVQVGDFNVLEKLGQGGLAVVYSAVHRPSGSLRALKISRQSNEAIETLAREERLLGKLHHPGIVRAHITTDELIEDRRVLVMEHVEGQTLRRWLEDDARSDEPAGVNTRQRFAEDLLTVLEYFEQQGVTHNDLKPDNLLVGKDGLRVIDFSIAQMRGNGETKNKDTHDKDDGRKPAIGGTARYRDMGSHVWSHATDRYAAALCLFELFVGRHAFNGRVRNLDEKLDVRDDEVDPPGLADFFREALDLDPAQRFTSAPKMREALRKALGPVRKKDDGEATTDAPATLAELGAGTSVRQLPLSNRASNALRRAGIHDVAALMSLEPPQVRAMRSVGTKVAAEILRIQDDIRERRLATLLENVKSATPILRPPVFPDLVDDEASVRDLPGLSENLAQSLESFHFKTVGSIAGATRQDLLAVPSLGSKKLARLLDLLGQRHSHSDESAPPRLIDDLWIRATEALTKRQREVLDRVAGVTTHDDRRGTANQTIVADEDGVTRERIRQIYDKAVAKLDLAVLDPVADQLDSLLDAAGGLGTLDDAAASLEAVWLRDEVHGQGLVRLLAKLDTTPYEVFAKFDRGKPVLNRLGLKTAAFKRYEDAAWQIAESWPPVEAADAASRLRATLGGYEGDVLALTCRIFQTDQDSMHRMAGGEIFLDSITTEQAVDLILDRAGDAWTPEEIAEKVDETFGGVACSEKNALEKILERLRPDGPEIRSITPEPSTPEPTTPASLLSRIEEPTDDEKTLRNLRAAARGRGFRIVVTPPEKHRRIGPTIAAACDATWFSFEDLWFKTHEDNMERMFRAERFAAQRRRLSKSADDLVEKLVQDNGTEGKPFVIGDTALLGTLDALDNVRYLYDLTMTGEFGFWVLVIPGEVERNKPRFNNRDYVWGLEGIVLQVEDSL